MTSTPSVPRGRAPRLAWGLRRALVQPRTWWLLAAYALLAGLFFLLRLASGQGGDYGGHLREMAGALLPLAALHGAGAGAPSARARALLRGPYSSAQAALALWAPGLVFLALCGALGASLPALVVAGAPVDGGRLVAGALALAALGAGFSALGFLGAVLLEGATAGALVGFAAGLGLWGAGDLAAATGLGALAGLDLSRPVLFASLGSVAPAAYSGLAALLVASLGLGCLGLEARRG